MYRPSFTAFCPKHRRSETFTIWKRADGRSHSVIVAREFGADVQVVELACGERVNIVLGRKLWR